MTKFRPNWERREHVLQFISLLEPQIVCDLGSGDSSLKQFLPEGVSYRGFDRNPTGESAVRVDFDREPLPVEGPVEGQVAVCLGLAEYLRNPMDFFRQVGQLFPRFLIFSHFAAEENRQKKMGWARLDPTKIKQVFQDTHWVRSGTDHNGVSYLLGAEKPLGAEGTFLIGSPPRRGACAVPFVTSEARSFLSEFVQKNPKAKILEFGSGQSTGWFSRNGAQVTSVEHVAKWHKKVQWMLRGQSVDLRCLPLPYHGACEEFPDNHFDLVLVDGRGRVECVRAAVRVLKPGGCLMLDNSERSEYQEIFKLLRGWEMTGSDQEGPDDKGFSYWKNGQFWQTHWWVKPQQTPLRRTKLSPARIQTNAFLRPLAKNLNGKVLDVGGSDGWKAGAGQTYRDFFPLANEYLTVDADGGGGVAVVADARKLPFKDSSQDVILSLFLLEHVEDYPQVLQEVRRVLVPGGVFLVGVPSLHRRHVSSRCQDYWRWSPEGLRDDLKKYGFGVEKMMEAGRKLPLVFDKRLTYLGNFEGVAGEVVVAQARKL